MKEDLKQAWINTGYELFAMYGPDGLKIEAIARVVGKNKSSFYHLFADLELFINRLLEYHISQSQVIAIKEQACKNIDPDLIEVILEHKQDLLFSRQLRVNRNKKIYEECFQQSNHEVQGAFMSLWMKEMNIPTLKLATDMFDFSLENFYLQITDENLNQQWLLNYFEELKAMINQFKNTASVEKQ